MTSPPLPPGSPSRTATAVHTRRCARHTTREAAARCPTCGGFFCRECVVDHGGRVLCSDCLAKAVVKPVARKRRWPAVHRTASLVGAVGVAWLSFYGLGVVLLRIPATFHDGTVWQTIELEDP